MTLSELRATFKFLQSRCEMTQDQLPGKLRQVEEENITLKEEIMNTQRERDLAVLDAFALRHEAKPTREENTKLYNEVATLQLLKHGYMGGLKDR